jgi:hypothetical protein
MRAAWYTGERVAIVGCAPGRPRALSQDSDRWRRIRMGADGEYITSWACIRLFRRSPSVLALKPRMDVDDEGPRMSVSPVIYAAHRAQALLARAQGLLA